MIFCIKKSKQSELCFDVVRVFITYQNKPRKKLVVTASRREGVYNRIGKPSETFCERGEARKRADDFFV